MKKIFKLSCLLFCIVFTSCEERIQLESLTNTYWESKAATEYSYFRIWFYDTENCKVEIKSETSDEPTVAEGCRYKLTQSGYVSISTLSKNLEDFFGGKYRFEDFVCFNGYFDRKKASLVSDKGIKFVYKGKAW